MVVAGMDSRWRPSGLTVNLGVMPSKVQRHERFRRALTLAAALACVPLGAVSVGTATPAAVDVRGRLTLLEKNNRPGEDVGQAVIWLEGGAGRATPVEAEISTAD